MEERQVFLNDPKEEMSPSDKNQFLGEKLCTTHVKKLIVRIERIEIGSQGWRITYRLPE